MRLHAISSLLPAVLLAMGCLFGGAWSWAGLAAMTVLVYGLDRALPAARRPDGDGKAMCWVIAGTHLCLLVLATASFGARFEDVGNAVLLWTGLGLWFGQVANSTAHELIHRPDRFSRRAGMVIFASLLNGHHVSAHLKVHHVHAATDQDPNSAKVGESAYAFFGRSMAAEFIAGLGAEKMLRNKGQAQGIHPYVVYGIVSGVSILCAGLMGGIGGVLALLTLSLYAQLQLLLSDYVQHYGLRRRVVAGRLEPVGPHHSWNAPHTYSAGMMLNAPRHSDHHASPAKPFTALDIDPDSMPVLPHSLPVMATIALVPPVWRRMMDARAAKWSTQSRDPVTKTAAATGTDGRILSG